MDPKHKPWMSQRQVDMIASYLRQTDIMLEYGAGGSTAHFAQFVDRYVSIEHDTRWVDELRRRGLPPNVELHLCPPDNPIKLPVWQGKEHDFRSYINYIDTLPYPYYDRVLIDGRVRALCGAKVLNYLVEDSLVFVHDYFERPRYHSIGKRYELVARDTSTPSLAVFRKL